MRKSVFLLVFGIAVLLGLFLLTPRPAQRMLTDLPWQISTFGDGTSKALGIHLGRDTLKDVIARYGDPEGLALFASRQAQRSLEAYFGTIHLGPLEGKLVVRLDASATDLAALEGRAIGSEGTAEGERRLLLSDADKRAQADRTVAGLSYIPNWSKMTPEFLTGRLGPATRIERISSSAERWLYPGKGLSVLVDSQGKEVFEYSAPGKQTPTAQ